MWGEPSARARRPRAAERGWPWAGVLLGLVLSVSACAPSCLWARDSCLLVIVEGPETDLDALLLTLELSPEPSGGPQLQEAQPQGGGRLPRRLRLEPPAGVAAHQVQSVLVRASAGASLYQARVPVSWPDGGHVETTLTLEAAPPQQTEPPDMSAADGAPVVQTPPPFRLERKGCQLDADGIDVTVLDANQDQNPDVATVAGDSLTILRGPFTGTSCQRQSHPVAANPVGLIAADIYADGYPDLVVASRAAGEISLFQNRSGDTFLKTWSGNVSGPPSRLLAVDVNDDGWTDVGVLHGTDGGTLAVFRTDGRGTLTAGSSYPTGAGQPVAVLTTSLQADRSADVTVASRVKGMSGQDAVVGLRLGAPEASLPVFFARGDRPVGLAFGAFFASDETGLAVLYEGSRELTLLRGSSGRFTVPALRTPIDAGGRGLATGDFDRNQLVDIAILQENEPQGDGGVRFLLQTQPGVFTLTTPLWTGGDQPRALAVADMNRDGRPDLVVVHARTRDVQVLTNLPL